MPEEKLESGSVEKCPSCGMDNRPYAEKRGPNRELLLRFYACWNCDERFFRECGEEGTDEDPVERRLGRKR